MNKWFSEQMTSTEARLKLFSLIEGKTKEERKEINEAYQAVIPIINKRELSQAAKGWLC